mmetsp:Transcript_33114/g.50649  ORF Transcript_33114/g.50649 Transcript_33114/m.50649 type:complete len:139 (+) Transcript_33114:1255-1671(+)
MRVSHRQAVKKGSKMQHTATDINFYYDTITTCPKLQYYCCARRVAIQSTLSCGVTVRNKIFLLPSFAKTFEAPVRFTVSTISKIHPLSSCIEILQFGNDNDSTGVRYEFNVLETLATGGAVPAATESTVGISKFGISA